MSMILTFIYKLCECQWIVSAQRQTRSHTHTRAHTLKSGICFSKAENPFFRNQLSSCPCPITCMQQPFIKRCVITQFLTTQHVNNLTPEIASALVYCFF